MADCEWLMKVQAFHDGELTPAERAALEAHLPSCAACRRELQSLRALSGVLASAPMPALRPEALRRFHRAGVTLEWVVMRTSEYFAAVAAVVLVACGLWLWHSARTAERTAPLLDSVALSPAADSTVADPEASVAQYIVADLSRDNRYE